MPINKPVRKPIHIDFAKNGTVQDYHGLCVTYNDDTTHHIENFRAGEFQLQDNWHRLTVDLEDARNSDGQLAPNVKLSLTLQVAHEQIESQSIFFPHIDKLRQAFRKEKRLASN